MDAARRLHQVVDRARVLRPAYPPRGRRVGRSGPRPATMDRIDGDDSISSVDTRLLEFLHSGALVYEETERYADMMALAKRMQKIGEFNEVAEQTRGTTRRLLGRARDAQRVPPG